MHFIVWNSDTSEQQSDRESIVMNTSLEVQDEYRKIAESVRTALLDLDALEEERRAQAEGGKV